MATIPTQSPRIQDHQLRNAVLDVQTSFGKLIYPKGKTLGKFGRTTNADSGQKVTIAPFIGATQYNETYSTSNDIDAVVSSSGSDTSPLNIEGHYYDSNNELVFATETVTLTGQTPAALSRSYCRINRKYVKTGTFAAPTTALVGNIYAYASDGVTVTNGVPQTDTAVKCMITAGENQTDKAASSISKDDFYVVTSIFASISKAAGSAVNVDVGLEYRVQGGVFLPAGPEISLRTAALTAIYFNLNPYPILPANCDFRLTAQSDTNNTTVTAYIGGILCAVQGDA